MGLDVDFVYADQAIKELQKLLSDQPHGEREGITNDITDFVDNMKLKWRTKK